MRHLEDAFVVLLLGLGYTVVYTLQALGRRTNTSAYEGNLTKNNFEIMCKGYINLDLASSIFLWYLPVSVGVSHLILSKWRGPNAKILLWLILSPHALFYAVALTTDCPSGAILTFQQLAFEQRQIQGVPAVWNATNSGVPKAVDTQWQTTIVFTAIAATLFSVPHVMAAVGYSLEGDCQFKWVPALLRLGGAIIFTALEPTVNKLFDEPVGINCRRGEMNPERVFDTVETEFGVSTDGINAMLYIIIAAQSIAILCQFLVHRSQFAAGAGIFLDLAAFVTVGALVSKILYTQKNPGCIQALEAVTSVSGRVGLTILTLGWLGSTFTSVLERDTKSAAYIAVIDKSGVYYGL